MPLTAGARLGPYEIVAPLGAGGMGEVYRAKDTRLGRDVAIKVLPQHLSANPEIRARFEREAKTVSSFNHPHICTLFDVGREGDTDFLVMELVEGETLASRLQRGPLQAAELLRLASQIAEALDRAHRAGVIHRDLKPGNIMITRSGAKLMDFGLSRATGLAAGPTASGSMISAMTQSPTVAQALTAEGTILGTFQYMAPEQLEGKEADARSDIWALGCVLYEMATGRRAFEGRSQASLIAAILEREPAPVGESSSSTGTGAANGPPQGLEWLIRNCLTKDPDERIQTAHDVKLQLQRIAEGAGLSTVTTRSTISGVRAAAGAVPARTDNARAIAIAWGVATLAVIAAAAFAAWSWPRLNVSPAMFRFEPNTDAPGVTDASWPRVSPDGRSMVFQATDSAGVLRAFLLRLDETTPHLIPGTEQLQRAYWSPDSREICFVAADKIQRVAVAGGSPILVCPAPGGADLSWGAKGQILLDGSTTDSLRAVPAGGGELHPATRISRKDHEVASAWPSFLPDGEHFLFIALHGDGTPPSIRLGRLGSLESKVIGKSDGRAEYAPGGWVVYVRGTALLAQKLDLGGAKLTGDPITITDNLRTGGASGHFSTSRSGVFAIERAGGNSGVSVVIVDSKGQTVATPALAGMIGNPRLSPDGKRVLYERREGNANQWGDVSVFDLERGTDMRLTYTGGLAVRSVWSPDGRRFVYTRVAGFGRQAVLMFGSTDGVGFADSIPLTKQAMFVSQWPPPGSRLVGYTDEPVPVYWNLQGPDRSPQPLITHSEPMANPQVSPDGHYVAGSMGNGNQIHVFVQTLEGPPGRWQVSSGLGGFKPVWVKGGRELLYESRDNKVMAVDIDLAQGFHAGRPSELFTLALPVIDREMSTWGCDATGERFVITTPQRSSARVRSIEVVTDFRSLVTRK